MFSLIKKINIKNCFFCKAFPLQTEDEVIPLTTFREESYEANYKKKDEHNDTLEKAIKNKDLSKIHTLLNTGADPNVRLKEHEYTSLILAAELEQPEIVALLLKHDANPNLCSAHGHTALTLVANLEVENNSDHTDIAKLLLDKGADINATTKFGTTALILAIMHENINLIKLLLERGANPNKKLQDNTTALMVAAQNGNQEIVQLLLEKEVEIDNISQNSEYTELMLAINEGHTRIVEDLLAHGANANACFNKKTPLLLACEKSYKYIVKLLLKNKADPNIVGNTSPLILAIQNRSIAIIDMLLQAGADPNDPAEQNLTPLMLSIVTQFMYGFCVLINHSKIELDKRRKDGSTALILAVKNEKFEMVKTLIKRKADPYQLDSNGHSALRLAYEENREMYNFLLENGVTIKF